jgi:ubiquinone/menaquinone biosynthesis C-methylase UbiE
MNIFKQVGKLVGTGFSTGNYYQSMNNALKRINDEYTMLHYPLFKEKSEDFIQAQYNLTDFCLSVLGSVENKRVLEIGCGNGVQAKYILNHFGPSSVTGIDLNHDNIEIANEQKELKQIENVFFFVDDAQNLALIKENSFDVVVNIESAFHYPDKEAFLNEIFRVLKPGGFFVIADILTTKKKKSMSRKNWKHKMVFHHWERNRYEEGLLKAKLKIHHNIDITHRIIDGFRNYRAYFRQMKKKGLLADLTFKMFYFVNVKLNIYLLKTRRKYLVFVGTKPIR